MAQYSTESVNLGRFDKSASVPDLERGRPDMGKANRYKEIADALGVFGKGTVEVLGSKIERERRDEANKRANEAYARQEASRKKNEAEIRAIQIETETGGSLSWDELTDKEKETKIDLAAGQSEISKSSYLTEEEEKSKFLKEAYQTRQTVALLKKHQVDYDAYAPVLVNQNFDAWIAQKDVEGGEKDWNKFITAKLEIYKLERAEQHFVGNTMLGEARKIFPENNDVFLKAAAEKLQDYEFSLREKAINARIDIASNPPEGIEEAPNDLSSAIELQEMVDEISFIKDERGNKITVFPREEVWNQVVDSLNRRLEDATDINDPIFKVRGAFKSKKGKSFFDLKNVGKNLEKWYAKAKKKHAELKKDTVSSRTAQNKIIIEEAKQTSTEHLITARSALTSQDPTPEEYEKAHDEEGKVPLNRLDSLHSALIKLRANKKPFKIAAGDYGDKYSDIEEKLVQAIDAIDPTHPNFSVPDSDEAREITRKFREEISTLSYDKITKLRAELAKTLAVPWIEKMHETELDERETEIAQEMVQKKRDLELSNAGTLVKVKNFEEASKKIAVGKRKLLGTFTKSSQVKEELNKIYGMGRGKNPTLRPEEVTALETKFQSKQKKLEDTEGAIKDSGAFTGYFNRVTSMGNKGEWPNDATIEALESEVNNYKWYGVQAGGTSERQRQLTGLLAAMKSGKKAYKLKKRDIERDNKFLKRFNRKTGEEQKKIDELVGDVATKRKTYKEALSQLSENKDVFLTANADLLAEGEGYKVTLNHEKIFNDGVSDILSQRTELEIAAEKLKFEENAQLNEETRIKEKKTLLKIYNNVLANPSLLDDEKYKDKDIINKLWEAKSEKVYKNGTKQDGVMLFKPENILKMERALRVEQKLKGDPSKIITDPTIFTSLRIQKDLIKTKAGADKRILIDEAFEYLNQQFDDGNINIGHYKTEYKELEDAEKAGAVETRDPYKQGDDALRLMFSGIQSIYTSNRKLLPPDEAGQLYVALNQAFSEKWEDIEWPEDATVSQKAAKARSLANSLTRVYNYEKGEKHPVDETLNERLKEFKMPKRMLRKYQRAKAKKLREEAEGKPEKKKSKTEFQLKLEQNDTIIRQLNSGFFINNPEPSDESLGALGVVWHVTKSVVSGEDYIYDPFPFES